jgi:glucosamine kinase
MNQPLYVIGIDGGATKTCAILCALDGTILSEAQGGPSNFQIIGIQHAAHTIVDLIVTCCHSMGCNISQIGASVAGLAGAGRLTDQQQMTVGLLAEAQKRNISFTTLVVESDARCALEGALNGKPGLVVIAGTGSIVLGKDAKGKIYRAGGWGRLIGDEGSGYAVGTEALRAVAKSFDRYGDKTKLRILFEEKYGFSTQEKIIDALYKEKFDVASLAPDVIEAASKGDLVSKTILTNASRDLVHLINAVLAKMKKDSKITSKKLLSFTGNLLINDNWYSRKMRSIVRREVFSVSFHAAESSPVVGAAVMAIEYLKKGSVD